MKIATFNVNNINKRLPNLLAWLKSSKPDVACLQELKAANSEFPESALRKAGYFAEWVGQKTWNGVAILARESKIVVTRRRLPRATTRADTSRLPSTAFSLAASTHPTAIRSRDRSSITSSPG